MPCNQIILASSVLENVISILPNIRLSTPFQIAHDLLKKPTTGLLGRGRDNGGPRDGDPIGEYDALEASNLANRCVIKKVRNVAATMKKK
jgi:hypothetical protein